MKDLSKYADSKYIVVLDLADLEARFTVLAEALVLADADPTLLVVDSYASIFEEVHNAQIQNMARELMLAPKVVTISSEPLKYHERFQLGRVPNKRRRKYR